MALLLCAAMVFPWIYVELPVSAATNTGGISTYLSDYGFSGKTISILGDSISTFENQSNGTAASTTNSTIKNNYVYYWTTSNYGVALEDTWWRQTASVLGMNVLVNNSYSGSRVYGTEFGTVGAYVDRSQQLHDDTGSNAGQTPDIIVIFMGTNDMKNADDPGEVSAINYSTLKSASSSYTPSSILEAYALMVYRAQKKYPKAEIYCCTLLPYEDISVAHVQTMEKFNAGVKEIAKNLGVYVADLYNDSGLTSQSENFAYHMANTLHPSAYGMDCITNCVVSALLENSQYNTKRDTLHSVSYKLNGVYVKQGKTMHAVDGKSLTLNLGYKSGQTLEVKVTMGGRDITSSCFSGSKISISKVTGDISITANSRIAVKSPEYYRWEMVSNALRSVNDDGAYYNHATLTAGSCTGGVYSSAQLSLGESVVLYHDRPWVIEWKSVGTWGAGVLLFSDTAAGLTAGNTYLFRRSGSSLLALGYCDGTSYHNYGVDLSKYGITNDTHVFRLVNEIAEDGSNMVYLYVDGVKLSAMNNYYVGSTSQNTTVDALNGMDIRFNTMGTSPHPVNKVSYEYIQVWENGIPEEIVNNDYRWETQNGAFTSITTDGFVSNNPTLMTGSIASDGKITNAYFKLNKPVVLLHNKPWSVEWKSSGTWQGNSDGALLLASSATTAAPYGSFLYRKSGSNIIVLGQRDPVAASYQNYGLSLADYGIDASAEHVYRLVNRVNDDGTNMIYLFVDGVELGAMNQYYVNDKAEGTTSNWVSGMDFTFEYMGTPQFLIGNCYMDYMQIDEGCSHEEVTWEITQAPTCTEAGTKTGICVECERELVEAVPATGHDYELTVIGATCRDYAIYSYTCGNCGDNYQIDAADYVDWVESIPEGMDPELFEAQKQYRYYDYSTVTSYETSMPGYTLKSSTWVQSGTGTVNYVSSWPSGFYTSNSLYTKYNNKSKKVTASETATTKTTINSDSVVGYLYYHWCYSGSVYSVASKSGSYTTFHAYYSTTSPSNYTCDTSDMSYYTKNSACSNSGWFFVANVYAQKYTTYNKQFTYEMKTDWSEWSATPVEAAENRTIETRTVYRLKDAALLEHSYDEGVVTVSPTCAAEGVLTYTCSACGDIHTEAIPVVEHSYDAVITAPGCISGGYTTYTCSVCGDSYIDDEVEAVGHNYNAVVTAPTCTEGGYTTYTCSACGDSYNDDLTEAVGHSWVDASCTGAKTCEICGETEGDALGHSYDAVVTAPTCTEGGYTTYTCTVCGDSYIGDEVEAVGHSYDAVVTAPTCTEGGYTTYTCTICGDSYVADEMDATAHSYVNGYCDICGDKDPDYVEIVIPTLSLSYPTLSFEAEILYNVYYTVNDVSSVVEMGLVTFETRDAEGTVDTALEIISGYIGSDGTYMVRSNGIPAKNLADVVYFKVYAKLTDGTYVYSQVAGYNGVAYARTIFSAANSSDEIKALMVAMLNYGAEAQLYFGYKTDSLMNAELTDEQKALVRPYDESMIDDVVSADSSKTGSFVLDRTAFSSIYPSVSFDGAFSINYYFGNSLAADNGMTLYIWDADTYESAEQLTTDNAIASMEMVDNGGVFWGVVAGIAAKEIDETVYVSGVYTCNGVTYSTGVIAYSLGRYCESIAGNDGSAAQGLGAATAVYGYYAENYFA